MRELVVRTSSRRELVDITSQIEAEIEGRDGVWLVYVPHTTAAVTINEGADPDVGRDLLMTWETIVDESLEYRHAEGNSPAHVMVSLIGSSVCLMVENGSLRRGTWQSVFFCEFDGPRRRKVWLTPF